MGKSTKRAKKSDEQIREVKSKLNEIFKKATLKRVKKEDSSEKPTPVETLKKSKSESYVTTSTNDGPRRRTSDNLLIYTEEELGIGKGGGTPLCPFDCDCCF